MNTAYWSGGEFASAMRQMAHGWACCSDPDMARIGRVLEGHMTPIDNRQSQGNPHPYTFVEATARQDHEDK